MLIIENMGMNFKFTFSFAGPVYFDIPATQLLSYYPYVNINSVVGAKGLVQPSLHQLPNNGVSQIPFPVYTPVYNQKPLVSSVKTPYPYPTVVPATFTSKVNLCSQYERNFCHYYSVFIQISNNYNTYYVNIYINMNNLFIT